MRKVGQVRAFCDRGVAVFPGASESGFAIRSVDRQPCSLTFLSCADRFEADGAILFSHAANLAKSFEHCIGLRRIEASFSKFYRCWSQRTPRRSDAILRDQLCSNIGSTRSNTESYYACHESQLLDLEPGVW